jgi:NAD-reducing hydrogenase small subunit
MSRIRLATAWLDGCSGCHMSLLDIDERLLELIRHADVVYSPLVDAKEFPENVDVALVEGAVSSTDDLEKIRLIRSRSRLLVALGDCAVTGNVAAMRNVHGTEPVLRRAYVESADLQQAIPTDGVPALLERVTPIHEVVDVDLFLPGCPPSAGLIYQTLSDLIAGRTPEVAWKARFG